MGKLHLDLSQEAFEQVQTIDPAAPLAHQLAGEVMESMQNTPGVVDAYKQALQRRRRMWRHLNTSPTSTGERAIGRSR